MAHEKEFELDLTKGKVVIGTNAYDDLQPLVKHPAMLVGQLLRLAENLVGIPLDYANYNLEAVRERLEARLKEIPDDRRQVPPLQLTGQVVREATLCDDEMLQDMFASLLASAADSETADDAHPAFAAIISQLSPQDAKLLSMFPRSPNRSSATKDSGIVTIDEQKFDVSNLVRLSLIEWDLSVMDKPFFDYDMQRKLQEIQKEHSKQAPVYRDEQDNDARQEDTIKALVSIVNEMQKLNAPSGRYEPKLSQFGTKFHRACCKPAPDTSMK